MMGARGGAGDPVETTLAELAKLSDPAKLAEEYANLKATRAALATEQAALAATVAQNAGLVEEIGKRVTAAEAAEAAGRAVAAANVTDADGLANQARELVDRETAVKAREDQVQIREDADRDLCRDLRTERTALDAIKQDQDLRQVALEAAAKSMRTIVERLPTE